MKQDIENVEGFSLFKTEVEKIRIKQLLELVGKLIPEDKIRWLVPNMVKNPEGKISISGFFIFFETIIIEFRDFLDSVNFDWAKYDTIYNVRIDLTKVEKDLSLTDDSMFKLKIRHTIHGGLESNITVFGKESCKYLVTISKELNKFLR